MAHSLALLHRLALGLPLVVLPGAAGLLLSVLNAEQLLRFDEGPPSQDAGWRWMNGRIPAAYPSYQTPEVLWMERFWSSGVIGRFDRLE